MQRFLQGFRDALADSSKYLASLLGVRAGKQKICFRSIIIGKFFFLQHSPPSKMKARKSCLYFYGPHPLIFRNHDLHFHFPSRRSNDNGSCFSIHRKTQNVGHIAINGCIRGKRPAKFFHLSYIEL